MVPRGLLAICLLSAPTSALWYHPAVWHCGSFDLEQLVMDSATLQCVRTDALDAINEQCYKHDNCYRAREGKDFCDNTFCHDAPQAVAEVTKACVFKFCVAMVPPTCFAWTAAACAAVRLLGSKIYEDHPTQQLYDPIYESSSTSASIAAQLQQIT